MSETIIVDTDQVLTGTTRYQLVVLSGATATIMGKHQGGANVRQGGRIEIPGKLQGSMTIDDGAEVYVTGDLQGSVSILAGGLLVIEPNGRVCGSLSNWGEVVNRGLRAGAVTGNEPSDEGGQVLQPTSISADGTRTYMMPPR